MRGPGPGAVFIIPKGPIPRFAVRLLVGGWNGGPEVIPTGILTVPGTVESSSWAGFSRGLTCPAAAATALIEENVPLPPVFCSLLSTSSSVGVAVEAGGKEMYTEDAVDTVLSSDVLITEVDVFVGTDDANTPFVGVKPLTPAESWCACCCCCCC